MAPEKQIVSAPDSTASTEVEALGYLASYDAVIDRDYAYAVWKETKVSDGTFREDLFHRLNVIRVHVPALRERREDIPTLARHFLKSAGQELAFGADVPELGPESKGHRQSRH